MLCYTPRTSTWCSCSGGPRAVSRPAITREVAGAPITTARSLIGSPHRAAAAQRGRRRPQPAIHAEHPPKAVDERDLCSHRCKRAGVVEQLNVGCRASSGPTPRCKLFMSDAAPPPLPPRRHRHHCARVRANPHQAAGGPLADVTTPTASTSSRRTHFDLSVRDGHLQLSSSAGSIPNIRPTKKGTCSKGSARIVSGAEPDWRS